MTRFPFPRRLTIIVSLCATAACAPAERQLMGNPENPYPLKSSPTVGEIVHLPTGIPVSQGQMLAVANDARVVYIGETHDNPASHRLELETLKGLVKLHPGRQALGMEMFTRSQQSVLDRWTAGKMDEKAFLKEVHWFDNWRMDFAYYRDLLTFARDRHIPVIALNADKSEVQEVRGHAPDQLSPEDRKKLPEMDMTDPYQRALVTAIYGDHVHGGMGLDGFVRAQTLWDETMAESVSRYLSSPAGKEKHLLVIAGGDHVSYGFGIPRRAFRRLPTSYVIIGGREIDIPADLQGQLMDVDIPDFPMVPYDFLAYTAYEKLPETGVKLGVMMERAPAGRGLVVKAVLPGSNAERAGLKLGDRLLAFDGEPLKDDMDLTYAVQRKHAGDHGTLQVEREGKTLKVDVVFQAAGKGSAPEKR
jgi:uncharacterized iron-regulated protein